MSLERCDQEVYDKGETVFLTNSIRTPDMEAWVQAVAKESGQRVDWRYGCGRAEMLTLGDLNAVRKAILKTSAMHDAGYEKAIKELGDMFDDDHIVHQLRGIWEYNRRENGLFRHTCSKCPGECFPQRHAGWDPTQEGHG